MTESSLALDQEVDSRYPLSFTQEWFITLDQGDEGGTFGPRFMTVSAVRVTGHGGPRGPPGLARRRRCPP